MAKLAQSLKQRLLSLVQRVRASCGSHSTGQEKGEMTSSIAVEAVQTREFHMAVARGPKPPGVPKGPPPKHA